MHTTSEKRMERDSLFWLPTKLLMRFFRHVDEQKSQTLTHAIGHVVGSLALVGVPALVLVFWKYTAPLLRHSLTLEVWLLLLVVLVSLGIGFLVRRKRTVIHLATFYTDKKSSDVTAIVGEQAKKRVFRIPASTQLFGDPDFGTPKKLTIEYSGWARQKKTVDEHGHIDLD